MPARFDCDACQYGKPTIQVAGRSLETRRYMHCGWIDERDWLTARPGDSNPRVPRVIGAGIDEAGVEWAKPHPDTGELSPDVCPGWAVRQPLITEICQAYKAFDKGAMESLFPNVAHAVAEGVMELSRTFDEFGRQKITASGKRAERNV